MLCLQIMDTLAEIQERHDAVRDLERKLLELQQVLHWFIRVNFVNQIIKLNICCCYARLKLPNFLFNLNGLNGQPCYTL